MGRGRYCHTAKPEPHAVHKIDRMFRREGITPARLAAMDREKRQNAQQDKRDQERRVGVDTELAALGLYGVERAPVEKQGKPKAVSVSEPLVVPQVDLAAEHRRRKRRERRARCWARNSGAIDALNALVGG